MTRVLAPCSVGELLDRISILSLKAARLESPEAAAERDALIEVRDASLTALPLPESAALDTVNATLWTLEEQIRSAQSTGTDSEIAALSRAIVAQNAERARLKRRIDDLTGSSLRLVKDYGRP